MITSRDGYDPDSFMDAAKETVINLLENNRQTKVKLIRSQMYNGKNRN